MEQPLTPWQAFIDVVLHPFHLLQSTVEYIQAWIFTRRWISLLAFLPALAILVAACGLIGYGAWVDQAKLLQRYSAWIETETANTKPAEATENDNKLLKEETVSAFGEMLLRRVLQLEKSNTRATYLVAAQLAKQGRVGQARQMMREIASTTSRGFPPAHAWLAVDRLMRTGVPNRDAKMELMHDLEVASGWDGTGPFLLSAYSDVLESEGKIGEAITVLSGAAKRAPELNVKLANLAYRHQRTQPLEQASLEARKLIQDRIRVDKATANDFAQLANLLLLERKPDEALEAAERGLRKEPENAALKRIASESLRMKYMLSIKTSETGTQVNMGLLDAALKIDPTNPSIAEEIAKLAALGQEATPELDKALNEQLANGQATAMTHLLLANRKLTTGDLKAAIPHLELALKQAPNSPVVLNNLSLAIARSQPENIDRALDLINRALAVVGNSPEFYDSHGEILMIKGDLLGAISSFEKAIGLDGKRLGTRRLLLKACELEGLAEMAEAQRAAIEKLEAKPEPSGN